MFNFTFERLEDNDGQTVPLFSGYGRLSLTLNGKGIWYDPRHDEIMGVEDYWDGLLDHLARSWRYLKIEDPYPLHFNPESPRGFLEHAMVKLREMGLSKNTFVEEEVKIFAFSDRHNLAAGMPDLFLPPLFILREGNDMRIVTDTQEACIPFEQAMERLEALGMAIAQAIHPQSQRGSVILEAWNQRHRALPVNDALSMLVGIPPTMIAEIAANDDPAVVFGYSGESTPSHMVLAARMTQHRLEPSEIRMVMDRISRVRLGSTTAKFAKLRSEAGRQLIDLASEHHYKQGYELAKWLRLTLSVPKDQTVDPGQWLRDWGVAVKASKLPREIDALARWEGDQACVVFNRNAARKRNRASLAHEIAHLLADTDHALPSVEVLGGRMPVLVEKRAKAFAAELLLPRSQVEQTLADRLDLDAIAAGMNDLTRRFNVSRQLTGYQMENLLKDAGKLSTPVQNWIKKTVDRYGRDASNI
ncbi:MAG: ImmA/IrrE family metallo-endopeptidase [Magnetococcales bacterium]|nr:ImmA/IrrE family metallo-endopeptidase [Magnetococcales bacterium]